MKTILPLLFFGVVAGSCFVGAGGKLPARETLSEKNRARLDGALRAGGRQTAILHCVRDYSASRCRFRRCA